MYSVESAISDSAQSIGLLHHLEDAVMAEFEMREDEPGVKDTTN